jgi:NADPH:quinone reductase-like Zn-dependent oxidoreductase
LRATIPSARGSANIRTPVKPSPAASPELARPPRAAHHVVDYTVGGFPPAGETYDVIFDTVGVTTFHGCKPALTATGVYLPLECGVREMVQALFTLWSKGKRLKYAVSSNKRESLELTLAQIASGALRPVIDEVYPMDQIAAAHRHVEGRHRRGSVVVAISAAA